MRIALVPGRGIIPAEGGQGSFCRYLAEELTPLGRAVVIVGDVGWVERCRALGTEFSAEASTRAFRHAAVVYVNGPGKMASAFTLARSV